MKIKKILTAILFCSSLLITESFAQPADFQVRAVGTGVSATDTINGLQAMAIVGSSVRFIWSAKSTVNQSGVAIPFEISSPSNPNMNVEWLLSGNKIGFKNGWENFDVWGWTGSNVNLSINDTLPDTFMVLGLDYLSNLYGFESETLIDVFWTRLSFKDTGVICIDSAFYTPTTQNWWMAPSGPPTWGGTPVGYPDGGYCITIYQPGCCTTPGDANGDASVNISDLTYIIARIFSGGPAPVCENEGDANGDQSLNIADAAFLVSRIFGGGPAPHCWWQSDPNDAINYTFFGIPDTLVISPCGSFNDTLPFFVSRGAGSTIFDLPAEFSIVDESAGIIASLLGPSSDSLHLSGTVNSGQDEFVVIRATSGPFGSGIQTDKIILITCQ